MGGAVGVAQAQCRGRAAAARAQRAGRRSRSALRGRRHFEGSPPLPPRSAASPGTMRPRVKLFVGNVPEEATAEELSELFAGVAGPVLGIALMKQFAFVHLQDEAAAARAIAQLNGHQLHGRRIVVEPSRPRPTNTCKIFVGNVSAACTSGELRSLFQQYGTVVECDVVKGTGPAAVTWAGGVGAPQPPLRLPRPPPAGAALAELRLRRRSWLAARLRPRSRSGPGDPCSVRLQLPPHAPTRPRRPP